jgi:alkylated DNA repair dioxygenase AlkB
MILFNTSENLLPSDGEVYFYPSFFEKKEGDDLVQSLLENIAWKQEPIKIFGKEIMQPRLTAWYGEPDKSYSYSGITMNPLTWTADLLHIKTSIEALSQVTFNSALLNLYRDGKDSMGWHRDNEKELGQNPIIGSVNFGATRTFKLRNHADKKVVKSIDLTHGSFLLMRGSTQHFWEHQIPKTSKFCEPRINITFRVVF